MPLTRQYVRKNPFFQKSSKIVKNFSNERVRGGIGGDLGPEMPLRLGEEAFERVISVPECHCDLVEEAFEGVIYIQECLNDLVGGVFGEVVYVREGNNGRVAEGFGANFGGNAGKWTD